MEDYTYIAKDFDINLYVRLHNYFIGLFGREDLLKDFCTKNDIDYRPKKDHKYKMPDSYLIKHGELKYLSGIRDKIILSFYEKYKKLQDENQQECQRLEGEVKNLKEIIESNKSKLSSCKKKLSVTNNSLMRVHLQDQIGGLETSIENEKSDLIELETTVKNHKATIDNNIANWNKQIDIINNIFAIRKEVFNRNISRRIAKELNYTNCISEFLDYSDSVKPILKGEF